jgi:hypothetical protein
MKAVKETKETFFFFFAIKWQANFIIFPDYKNR